MGHKAKIIVDEEGTEAAAATYTIVDRIAIDPYETFCADRPFLYAIRDTRTGALLFTGRVVDGTMLEQAEPDQSSGPPTPLPGVTLHGTPYTGGELVPIQ